MKLNTHSKLNHAPFKEFVFKICHHQQADKFNAQMSVGPNFTELVINNFLLSRNE